MLTELQKARPHSILLRRTSAFGQGPDGTCVRELHSWDALVGESSSSGRAPILLTPTFLAFQEWQDLWPDNLKGEKEETTLVRTRAGSKRLWFYLSHQCQFPQRCQHSLQEPESYHLFQLWQEGSLRDKVSWAKEGKRHLRLMTVLTTSPLMRLTWTVHPEATLERVPCIRYLVWFRKDEWRFG